MEGTLQEIGLDGNPLFGTNQMHQQAEAARTANKEREIAEKTLRVLYQQGLLKVSLHNEIARRAKMEGAGDSLLPILLSIEVQKIESNAKKNNNGEKTFLIKIQEIRDGFAKIGEENGIEPEKVKALSNVLLEDLIVRDWR